MLRIKNNTGGYFSIQLEDSTGVKGPRVFRLPSATSQVTIPDDYAKSIAITDRAMSAYKKGYFTCVSGEEVITGTAVENGVGSKEEVEQIKKDIVPNAILTAALKSGTLAKIKEYLNSNNRDRLVQLAQENLDSISSEKIQAIEEATGVSLRIE